MRYPDAPIGAWTRESGYPKFSRADGGLTIVDRFFAPLSAFDHDDMESYEALTFAGMTVKSSSV
jgi:hypothetical protein